MTGKMQNQSDTTKCSAGYDNHWYCPDDKCEFHNNIVPPKSDVTILKEENDRLEEKLSVADKCIETIASLGYPSAAYNTVNQVISRCDEVTDLAKEALEKIRGKS